MKTWISVTFAAALLTVTACQPAGDPKGALLRRSQVDGAAALAVVVDGRGLTPDDQNRLALVLADPIQLDDGSTSPVPANLTDPGITLGALFGQFTAAMADGQAALATEELRNHLFAVGQAVQTSVTLNQEDILGEIADLGHFVEHLRCLSALPDAFDDNQPARCDVLRAVGGMMTMSSQQPKIIDNVKKLLSTQHATFLSLAKKAQALYAAAANAAQGSAVPAPIQALRTLTERLVTEENTRTTPSTSFGDLARTSVTAVVELCRTEAKNTGKNPLYEAGNDRSGEPAAEADLAQLGPALDQADADFAALTATGDIPQADLDSFSAQIDAAVNSVAVDAATAVVGAAASLAAEKSAAYLQFLALHNATQSESRKFQTLSNASRARHDIAMNAIRNLKA